MPALTTMLLPATHAVLPLAWWMDAELDAVRVRVEDACSAWVRDWIGSTPKVETRVARVHERIAADRETWAPLGARGESTAWVQVRAGAAEDVVPVLFPAEPGHGASPSASGIAHAVAAKARTALAEALQSGLGLDAGAGEAAPEAALFKPWSGSALVSMTVPGRSALAVLLNSACVRSILGPGAGRKATSQPQQAAGAIVPLAQALADRRLPLRIGLSPCELDLGSLEGLRVGDIVPLAHSLEAPLLVSTAQDVQVCAGFLGRQGGLKAIELARETSPEQEAVFDQHTRREV